MLSLILATIVIAANATLVVYEPAQTTHSQEQQQEVFLGVSHEAIFRHVGLTLDRSNLGSDGIKYIFTQVQDKPQITKLGIGVHPSVPLAIEAYKKSYRTVSVGPSNTEGVDIGHGMIAWIYPTSPVGTVFWYRDNVFCYLTFRGEPQQTLQAAKQIDQLIANDRQIAPRGVWPTPPRIADVTLEGSRKLDTDIDVTLNIEGLQVDLHQALSHSTIRALYRDDYNDLLRSENGKFILRLLRPKSDPVVFIVANNMNVIVSKTIEVELEE